MTTKQLKNELRLNGFKFDPWGTSMAAFFELADIMYHKYGYCPNSWGFRPSPFGFTDAGYYTPIFKKLGEHKLILLGEYLHRLTSLLQHCGKSY